jgi:hypothetical protein
MARRTPRPPGANKPARTARPSSPRHSAAGWALVKRDLLRLPTARARHRRLTWQPAPAQAPGMARPLRLASEGNTAKGTAEALRRRVPTRRP